MTSVGANSIAERKRLQAMTLEVLTGDIQRVFNDLEEIKRRS